MEISPRQPSTSETQTGRAAAADRCRGFARRKLAQLGGDERDGALDLQPAHVGAGEHVARWSRWRRGSGRSGRCPHGKSWRTSRFSAAGPRRRADQPQVARPRPAEPARSPRTAPAPRRCPRAGRPRSPRPAAPPPAARGTAPPRVPGPGRSRRRPGGPARGRSGCRTGGGQVQEVAAEPAAVRGRRAGSRRRWRARPGRRCGWPAAPAPARCRAAPAARAGRWQPARASTAWQ